MSTYRIYLKTGRTVDVQADKIEFRGQGTMALLSLSNQGKEVSWFNASEVLGYADEASLVKE